MKRILPIVGLVALIFIPSLVVMAQGFRIWGSIFTRDSVNKAIVRAGQLQVHFGANLPRRKDLHCHIASVSGQATTAAVTLSIEAGSDFPVAITEICATDSPATANTAKTLTVQRRFGPSSGGTVLTANGTGTSSIGSVAGEQTFTGIARLGGTPGTALGVVDQWGWTSGELGAGLADPRGPSAICKQYGSNSSLMVIPPGISNGLTISFAGAVGGIAVGTISARICEIDGIQGK